MNHPKTIEKYNGSQEELCEDIWNLDYDALVKHFELLKNKFGKDAINDPHSKVAKYLANIAQALQQMLENDVKPMADHCRPYNERWAR